jgi:hypothetical protein
MNWREFLKTDIILLLTLPGAMLWSIPIGFLGWALINTQTGIVAFWRPWNRPPQ